MSSARYLNLPEARRVYAAGGNVTEYLRESRGLSGNTDEVIEIAYDLQAGSYATAATANGAFIDEYAMEMASIVQRHVHEPSTLLDVGTGELTTLSYLARHLTIAAELLAFDISWSRIRHGLEFAAAHMPSAIHASMHAFVGDMARIPLPRASVDVVVSSHALEPNGGREEELLTELFRVAKSWVIVFEPSFENNSEEGKARMTRLGYVRGLTETAKRCGANVVEVVPMRTVANPLNPTWAHVLEMPGRGSRVESAPWQFTDPGEETPLVVQADCFFSQAHGLAYPRLQNVPVLLERAGFLASALDRFATE